MLKRTLYFTKPSHL